MKKYGITIFFIVLAAAIFLISESVFIIDERENGIKLRLGQVVSTSYKPGIHFKYPFVESVKIFDARLQTLDAVPQSYLTKEKKKVVVDSYTTWRINNSVDFYITTGGRISQANRRLSQIIQDGLRTAFGIRGIQELINKDRELVMNNIRDAAKIALERFGIEVVDFRINRIELSFEVSNSIYRRMSAERQRVAKDFRSRGAEEAEKIQAAADRQRVETLSNAYRQSEILRGEGDAIALENYANAYNRDIEFYRYQRTLQSYVKSFVNEDRTNVLILDSDDDYFQLMNSIKENQ